MKATYKNDKMRIEDALIPTLLNELMIQHIQQLTDKDPSTYDKAFALLRPDIAKEINNEKLHKRMNRLKESIFQWFIKQGWVIPKAYMCVSLLADILHANDAVVLGEGTKEVVEGMKAALLRWEDSVCL